MIRIRDLQFRYPRDGFRLAIPTLEVVAGERVALIGPSGSGKTTLLHLIAGIKKAHSGELRVNNLEPGNLSDAASRSMRIRTIGMVFQDFGLLDYLSVTDNILLPFRIGAGFPLDQAARDRAALLAETLVIADKLKRPVGTLSQGEKQRVAVCRALVTSPPLLLADEPTGNLDPATKTRVLDAMLAAAGTTKATVLTVTHDHGLLGRFDRVIDFMEFVGIPEGVR